MQDMKRKASSDLRFVAPFIRTHGGLIATATLCMAFFALTTSAYAYLVGPALKVILSSMAAPPGAEPTANALESAAKSLGIHPVVALVTAIIALAIVRSASQACESILIGKAGQNIQRDVRNAMFEKLMNAQPLAMQKMRKGDLASKLVADVTMMEIAFTHAAASMVRDGLQVLFLAGLAFYLDPVLTLAALAVLPPGGLIVYYMSGRIRRAYRSAMDRRGDIAARFVEAAGGLPVIKIFLAEGRMLRRLREANDKLHGAMMKAIYLAAGPAPLMEILAASALGFLLLYAQLISKVHVERPEHFISFFAAVFLLYRPIKSLGSVTSFLQQGLAATRRIGLFFEVEKDSAGGETEAPPMREGLRLDDVHFRHGEREVLSGVSLEVPRGGVFAVVGASGEGKTTLVHIVAGFLRPRRGRLLWDGVDAASMTSRSLRARISLVSQDPFLMNASIEENILLGVNLERRDELARAVSHAGLDGLISRLPDGLRTNVEEEASLLSAGERQRICIARAILSDADLMILDEAASSIDSRSEDAIHSSLRAVRGEKTVVVVSHRLSTVKAADRIAVLEGGRIVEEGTYKDLARPGTVFHDLFGSQIARDTGSEGG